MDRGLFVRLGSEIPSPIAQSVDRVGKPSNGDLWTDAHGRGRTDRDRRGGIRRTARAREVCQSPVSGAIGVGGERGSRIFYVELANKYRKYDL